MNIYSHFTNRLLLNFFYPSHKWPKSCAQNAPLEFSEKYKFWLNSYTNVAPPCGIVQVSVSFQMLDRAFLSLKKAVIRIKIDLQVATISLFEKPNLWCSNSLFKFMIVTNKNKKLPTFLCHAAVQRRISTKLCKKIDDVRVIFALPWFLNQTGSFGARRLQKFWGKCPIAVFCL